MPDTFSHFLHGYFIYGLKGGVYAILPDILSFGRLTIKNIPIKFNYLINGKFKKILEKPKLEKLDKTDKLLYNVFHSLVVWFLIYKLTNGKKEFICLFLSIIIDVLMHEKTYLPTPFLYPLSDYKFDGIHWYSSKLGWIISIFITYLIYNNSHLFRSIIKDNQ